MSDIANSNHSRNWITPGRVLAITIIGIFLAEVIAMLLINNISTLTFFWQVILDSLIIIVLVFPLLYFLSFKPLLNDIAELERADIGLREAQADLELRVQERTNDLLLANEKLYQEIAHRHQISDELRKAYGKLEETLNELNTEIVEHQLTEVVLRMTQQILQTIVDYMPAAVCLMHGSDLRLQLVNTAYQAIAPGKEMLGRTLDEIWPEAGQNFSAICHHVLETGEPYSVLDELNMIERFPGNPLEPAYFTWSLHRVQLPGDQGWGLLNSARETTERKLVENALRESRRKYQDLIETTIDFIWEIDDQGRFTYCSPQMEKMWGIKPDEMIGKTIFDLLPLEERDNVRNKFVEIAALAIPIRGLTTVSYNSKGELAYYEINGNPYFDQNSKLLGFRGVTRDVTERKQVEEIQRVAHAQLEQRVQERTRDLIIVNNELITEVAERERAEADALSNAQLAQGLLQAITAVNSIIDIDQVMNTILEQIQCVIPYQFGTIALFENQQFHLVHSVSSINYSWMLKEIKEAFSIEDYPLYQKIISTQQPLLIDEVLNSSIWNPVTGMDWVRAFAAVPLVLDGKLLGIISLSNDQPKTFSKKTLEHLMAFAHPAALAIRNASLFTAETHSRQVAEALSRMGLALIQSLDLDTLLCTLLEHLHELIPITGAYIVISEDKSRLVVRATYGFTTEKQPRRIIGSSFESQEFPYIQEVLTTQKTLLISDTREYPRWEPLIARDEIRSWLGIPIMLKGVAMGVIGLVNVRATSFTAADLRFLESMAVSASAAIQNAWLFGQVRTSKERLQFLARRLVEVQENELRYIAQELHDEIGQTLTSLSLGVQLIKKEAHQPEMVVAEAEELNKGLESAMDNLHRLAIDLRPASLDQLGFEAALRQHVQTIQKKFNLEIQFEMIKIEERLPARMEIALYRIVQEALNNVVRHANATHVDILMQSRADHLLLIVEDNGSGFIPEIATKGDRLGIFGMRERAEMLGGNLTIESSPGKGTTVLVEVPYANSNSHRR